MDDVKLLNGGVKIGPQPEVKGFSQPRIHRPGGRGNEIDTRIRRILWEHPRGLTVGEVGRALTLSRSAAGRHLDALAGKGEIDLSTYGQTRVFTLPRRVSLASSLGQPSHLVLVLSGDLQVLEASDSFLSLFHLNRDDLIGTRIPESPFAAYAGERLIEEVRRAAGGKAGSLEFDTLVGDAQYSFRARISPLSSSRGAPWIVLSLDDITGAALHRRSLEGLMDTRTLSLLSSRNQILEEILQKRQKEEQMQIIQDSMDRTAVPAFWIGRDGRFLRVNPAAAALLGYREGEMAGMSISDVDADRRPGTWETRWETLKARSSTSFESRFRTKKDDILWVDVKASHVPHGDQEFGLLLAEEITGRKEAEAALRDSEASLRAFFNANPDPSFLVDSGGRLLLANKAATGLLGTELARLIGTSIFDAMPEKAAGARAVLNEVLEHRRYRIYDEEIADRYFHTILCPILNASGEVERVAIFARDLTERKRVEDALRQANAKLNLLTAITRHDVLNDIAALSMYLALPGISGAQGEGFEVAGKLAPLVRSLQRKMEFTRDYADLGMKTPTWEEVSGAVQRGVAAVDTRALRIDLDLPALEIYADPLFERVISNLVDNTIRHGEHATLMKFRARIEGDTGILSIEDDGVGVPHGKKESIFRAGYGRHTGFGLFLIQEILAITGMSIRENGEPGNGARFEIRIPAGGFRLQAETGDPHADA
jgi:PAS domain S-box-containing protein